MDKLRPILEKLLEQKFWVLSVTSLLMIITGWWLGTGSLNAEYEERKATLDSLDVSSGNSANSQWIERMSKNVKVKTDYLDDSGLYLRSQQKTDKIKNWPRDMLAMMKEKPYRGEIPVSGLEVYRTQYKFLLQENEKDCSTI